MLHEIGCLHNDIKLENILLKSEKRMSLDSSQIILIDFGLSMEYIKGTTHLEME